VPFVKIYGRTRQAIDDNIKQGMRSACCVTKLQTHTQNMYVIPISCFSTATVLKQTRFNFMFIL